MVMQAFVDDSHDDQIYLLAGHVASAEAWAKLSVEWERLLPKFGVLMPNGKYAFKMNQMAQPHRLENVAPFYRLIEEHVSFSFAAWLWKRDIPRAYSRLVSPTCQLAFADTIVPFDIVFCGLLDYMNKIRDQIAEMVDFELPLDFYFDEQAEKARVYRSWDNFVRTRQDNFSEFISGVPKFENDERFLPLQAADLWAWWVREWIQADTPEQMHYPDFGPFTAKRRTHMKIDLQLTEDALARVFRTASIRSLPPGHLIYDVTFSLNGERVPKQLPGPL